MKRGRLPLTALRGFEVAGRRQSFTAAAEELFISQAAVSRQVRNLEHMLGCDLFIRLHRKVVLTPNGQHLLALLTRSFDEIEDQLQALQRDGIPATVRISVEPSFAGCWLVSHLAAFRDDHPAVDIVMDVDARLIDFRGDQPQIAIRHSEDATRWPRSESRPLRAVRMIPVIAPQLAAQLTPITRPGDLRGLPLLHEDSHDLWAGWFTRAGIDAPPPRGSVFADGALVQQAAVQGQGIGLVDEFLSRDERAAGRLRQLFPLAVPYGRYFVVTRRFADLPPPAMAFVDWLCRAAAETDASASQPPDRG